MTVQTLNSAELVENARKHIAFLEKLHALGITLTTPSKHSLRRYKLWLVMLHFETHEATDKIGSMMKMIPPADVAWLWHCHRLAPCRYVDYI